MLVRSPGLSYLFLEAGAPLYFLSPNLSQSDPGTMVLVPKAVASALYRKSMDLLRRELSFELRVASALYRKT